jgi:predicted MPP superfamily phosphohydrolase
MIKRILVIPDAHAHPDVPNTRFTILGKYIAHKQPEVIVCLGDWADMPALSSYDVGTRKAEGRLVVDDFRVAVDAQEKMFREINRLNIRLKKAKKKLYQPELYMCLGNHENRINRAINKDPKMYGMYGLQNLKYEQFGWNVIPFLKKLELEGVSFIHYWPNAMNRPINAVSTIMNMPGGSKVSGHSHVWDQRRDGRISPKIVLVAGCYLDPETQIDGEVMDYTFEVVREAWWNGVFLLNKVENGHFNPVPVDYEYLRETYGPR